MSKLMIPEPSGKIDVGPPWPRCTSLSEDGRRCHGDAGHPGTHWAGAMRIWSDTETLLRPIPPGADQ